MKKHLVLLLVFVMLLTLAACGGKTAAPQNAPAPAASGASGSTAAPAPAQTPAQAPDTAQQDEPAEAGIKSADGTLTVPAKDVAVVVNGTPVPVPYRLGDLEAAGVPADESRSGIELGAGDFFSANLYLDDNEDYLIIPAYYNGGDSSISITEAEAEEIMMTTYADEPEDQGVSILGVPFGMPRSEVKALLGEPIYDDGSYLEWHVEIPEMAYEGTLSMYFTEDADGAGVSQVDLTVFPK